MANVARTAEARFAALGIRLPEPPTPFGAYVPAVRAGNLLFLSGMLATSGGVATTVGVLGKDLEARAGQDDARAAALNVLALVRRQLGTLDRVKRLVRLGVYVASTADFASHVAVADGASTLLRDVFGENALPARLVIGVASLPLGSPVELETIFEVSEQPSARRADAGKARR